MDLLKVDYLSGPERKELEDQEKSLKAQLEEIKHSEYALERSIDPAPILKKLRRIQETLHMKVIPQISNREKAELSRRAKDLEKSIKEGMPTYDEMMGKRHGHVDNPNSKYQEADPAVVRKNIQWTLGKEKEVREWRNIMRILEPENPGAADVERLRSRRGKIAKGGINETV